MSSRVALVVCVAVVLCGGRSRADEAACSADAFRALVAGTSAKLSRLNEENAKALQDQLHALRSKFNWTDAEFVAKAAPIVKDEATAAIDRANEALLGKVQSLDATGAATENGRCAMLGEVRRSLEQVIANTTAKWQHMLAKASEAGASSLQAGLGQ